MTNNKAPKILYAFRVDSIVLDEVEQLSKESSQSCSSIIRAALFSFLDRKKTRVFKSKRYCKHPTRINWKQFRYKEYARDSTQK